MKDIQTDKVLPLNKWSEFKAGFSEGFFFLFRLFKKSVTKK